MAWSPWLHNACYGKYPRFCTGTLFLNRGFVCLWVVFLAVVLVSFAFVLVVLSYVSAVFVLDKFGAARPFRCVRCHRRVLFRANYFKSF